MNNRQISEDLVITESTIRVHIFNILNKLMLHNRTDLAAYALKNLEK